MRKIIRDDEADRLLGIQDDQREIVSELKVPFQAFMLERTEDEIEKAQLLERKMIEDALDFIMTKDQTKLDELLTTVMALRQEGNNYDKGYVLSSE